MCVGVFVRVFAAIYRCSQALAGSEVVACDSPCGRLGVTICYDMRFPELYQKLTFEHGAQVGPAWRHAVFFVNISEHADGERPAARARSEGGPKGAPRRDLSDATLPVRSDPSGVRRRRAPRGRRKFKSWLSSMAHGSVAISITDSFEISTHRECTGEPQN